MSAKTLFIVLLTTIPIKCHSKQIKPIDVYIEKLNMHWKFRLVGDTLSLNDHIILSDTVSVKIILKDDYGTYDLIMMSEKLGYKTTFHYQGSKNKFQIDKVPNYDFEGSIIKYSREKMYVPVLKYSFKTIQ